MQSFAAEKRMMILTGMILFCGCFLFCQTPTDSIPTGIIKVKRPPIPASYRVSMVCVYPQLHGRTRISEFSGNQIVFTDSVYNPNAPEPQNLDLYSTSNVKHDSSFVTERSLINSSSEGPFDWKKYLSSLNYTFAWTDTSRSDSAQYQFTLDKRGKATCKPLPYAKADSTCRVFEDKTKGYATVLTKWFPAQRNKREGSTRTKKVACVVIVTFYAYDPNLHRLLPLEIAPFEH